MGFNLYDDPGLLYESAPVKLTETHSQV